jgi:formate hydrogenlyase subunit 4
MMGEQAAEDNELVQLGEVYGFLKRDAKDMLQDLLAGVSLWKSTAKILFGVALLAFLLVPLFFWGAASSGGNIGSFLGLIGVFMFGLGLTSLLTAFRYRQRYKFLKAKYSELFETATKLS